MPRPWHITKTGWHRYEGGNQPEQHVPYTPEERAYLDELGASGSSWNIAGEFLGAAVAGWGPALSAAGYGPAVAVAGIVGAELREEGTPLAMDPQFSEPQVDPNFDWQQYLANYEDLRLAGIGTAESAWQHWQEYGQAESRTFQPLGARMFEDEGWGSIFESVDWGSVAQQGVQLYSAYQGAQARSAPPPSGGGMMPAVVTMPSGGGGDVMPTAGVGGAIAAGGIWLGSWLARAFGRGAAGAVMTAANGVRVRMSQLWPLTKRYGAEAVAGGLGISTGALGVLLTRPEALSGRSGRRGRGRGISARDVKTTRRTLKSIRKLYSMMPKRPSTSSWGGGGYYRKSRYRRRYA